MKKPKHTKLKKKEIKTILIQTIEQTLGKFNNERALQKVRKTIKEATKQITKEFFRKLKKGSDKDLNSSRSYSVRSTNKKFIKNLKGKPTKENIKEVIKI